MIELFDIRIDGNLLYTKVIYNGIDSTVYDLVYDISNKDCPLIKSNIKEEGYFKRMIECYTRRAFQKYSYDKMPDHTTMMWC